MLIGSGTGIRFKIFGFEYSRLEVRTTLEYCPAPEPHQNDAALEHWL
jgi:hypothetical protein